jgi:hypothetical protein
MHLAYNETSLTRNNLFSLFDDVITDFEISVWIMKGEFILNVLSDLLQVFLTHKITADLGGREV